MSSGIHEILLPTCTLGMPRSQARSIRSLCCLIPLEFRRCRIAEFGVEKGEYGITRGSFSSYTPGHFALSGKSADPLSPAPGMSTSRCCIEILGERCGCLQG